MPRLRLCIPLVIVLNLTWVSTGAGRTATGNVYAGQDTSTVASDSLLVKQIQELGMRLLALEEQFEQSQQEARMQTLRQRAQQRAQERDSGPRDARSVTFHSAQRQMSILNPEVSMSGDFLGWYRSPELPTGPQFPLSTGQDIDDFLNHYPTGNRFYLRDAEINVVAPLDPYTRGKFYLSMPSDGNLAVEEAYMTWINLPAGLNLKIGYYMNQFGQLNRWHEHALPQVDKPHVLSTFLGANGLSGLGISCNFLLPQLWSQVNELTLEYISGGDGVSFTGEGTRDRVTVARLKNYYDLSADTYLELGISGAYGNNDIDRLYETTLAGIDLNYKWLPTGRSKYRTFELRSEVIYGWRETPTGTVRAWGAYVSAQNRLTARILGGLRLDYTQLPWDSDHNLKAVAATLDYWQSEFVFFRLQIDTIKRTFADNESRLMLQVVWSMGPHKHEAY